MSRWPPRASSTASLAVLQSESAALYMRPSARRWASLTGPLCPRCSASVRNRIDVNGERRSCAISTTRSRPLGPPRQDARSCGSGSGWGSGAAGGAGHSSTAAVFAPILCLPAVVQRLRIRVVGWCVHRRGLALDDPPRRPAALQPPALHHPGPRPSVHAPDAGGPWHV